MFILFIADEIYSQNVLGVQSKSLETNPVAWGFIRETPVITKEVKGDTYLHAEWFSGTLNFINGSQLTDKDIRYNLESNIFEIKIDGIEKVSDSKYVKSFQLFNEQSRQTERYVNAFDINTAGPKLIGFLKELYVGNYTLYSRMEIKLVQGKYVSALDMGDEDDYYTKKIVYYVLKDRNLMEVNVNKRQFAESIPEYEEKVLEYIKEKGLSLKRENDLIALIVYLNSLNV